MDEPKMYTLPEAKVLLAREECEREGHDIRGALRQRNASRQLVLDLYHCVRGCGVTVTVEYPAE